MSPDDQLEQAVLRHQQGDFEAAASLALGLVGTPARMKALELGSVCLIEARRFDELMRIMANAEALGYPPALLFSRALDHCLRTDRLEAIEELASRIPPENPLYPIGVYYTGCTRVVRGDVAAALAIFALFRSVVSRYLPHVPFGGDRDLNVLYRQGILVAGPDEVAERLAAAPGLPPAGADYDMVEKAAPARTLVCACADARYVERFGRGLLESVAPEDALHLHVVDPTPETQALLDALAKTAGPGRLGASTSRDPNYGNPTAYACARFFVGPRLIEAYDRPIVVVDVDLRLRDRLATLDLTRPDFDFACFATPRREPCSLYSASLMVFTPSAAGREFVAALGAFCLYGLKLPYISYTWLLDQAALYSVKHYFALRRPEFRFGVLNDIAGGTGQDFIELVTSDEEKYAMRWARELAAREARAAAPGS